MKKSTKVLIGLGAVAAIGIMVFGKRKSIMDVFLSNNWVSEKGGPVNKAGYSLETQGGKIILFDNGKARPDLYGQLDSKGIYWTYPATPQNNHYWLKA